MNKKLVLGISIGISVTSILIGSIIFGVECNKYSGYKVVYKNVTYSNNDRKNMEISDYSYSHSDSIFSYSRNPTSFINLNSLIAENNKYNNFLFNLSFDLENVSKVSGKLYVQDLESKNLISSSSGHVSVSNVFYDSNKYGNLSVFVDSFYKEDRSDIAFKVSNIKVIIWGK